MVSLLVFPGPFTAWSTSLEQIGLSQTNGLHVHNLNTTLSYSGIQEAVDAAQTIAGHVIRVDSGVYSERVSVNKALSLVGEDRSLTVIDGSGGTAVQVQTDNVEVKNFTVRNGVFGIYVNHSDNARLIGNVVSDCSYGIRLYYSRNARVLGNYVSRVQYFGIDLDSSGNSFLRDNQMVGTKYNFGVDGNSLSDFLNDIGESNTVNGKPVRYLVNQRELVIDSLTFQSIGYLGLVNSTNVTVKELDVMNNKQGLFFAFVSNSSITGLNAIDNWVGIYVTHSQNVSVRSSNANYNFDYGIKFFVSPRSYAIGNNVDNNGWAGIGLFGSPSSNLDKNEANFNTYNLHIVSTNSSIISRNNASGLFPYKAGSFSIAVYYSHNNLIFLNAFSTALLYVESRNGSTFTPGNKWDNGYEGNYWLNRVGTDDDFDGVGDAEYKVGEDNVDGFPLMGSFQDFFVLFKGRFHSITVISNSTISNFKFNSTDARISLTACGPNGTLGFCRVAVPNVLIRDMGNGRLDFVIEALQPTLVRNWTDDNNHYWYFSYVHLVSTEPESPDLWFIPYVCGVVALLMCGAIVFVASKKWRPCSKVKLSYRG